MRMQWCPRAGWLFSDFTDHLHVGKMKLNMVILPPLWGHCFSWGNRIYPLALAHEVAGAACAYPELARRSSLAHENLPKSQKIHRIIAVGVILVRPWAGPWGSSKLDARRGGEVVGEVAGVDVNLCGGGLRPGSSPHVILSGNREVCS